MAVGGTGTVSTQENTELLNLVSDKLRNDAIELPSLPDIAIDVRIAVGRDELSIAELVRLIQQDPGLTAYLIKVSLSAGYNRGHPISNLSVAISRLGLNTTRDLTVSYALKSLFQINDPVVKKYMRECWQRSVHTAALAHVIARHCGFDPDRALLAGLMQDIGALPLLANLKDFPDIGKSPAEIEKLLGKFTGKISGLVLHKWRFDNEMIVAALNRENWWYDGGSGAQLVDLVLVARYHSYLKDKHKQHINLPKLHELPAFHKLALDDADPATGIGFLLEAEREVEELQQLFR